VITRNLAFRFTAFVALLLPLAPIRGDDFALQDGDKVVFLGDSLTAARTYSKIVECYTLLRFPARKITFVNSGIGGDTAEKSLQRLERDVFAHRPTKLLVMFGTNDIGWGLYADDEHKQKYLAAIGSIIKQCQERKIRVYICSEPVTAEDPDKSETGFLKQMCDQGMELARERGEASIDVNGYLRDVQRRVRAVNEKLDKDKEKQVTLHVADGVHLNDLGHLAVAAAMLKGLGAPAEVSQATIDAEKLTAAGARGCQISDVARGAEGGIEFTRLDEGLPFNGGLFYALNFAYVPVHQELNQYLLKVTGLPEGRYRLTVDGRGVSSYSAAQLAKGVNIASATTDGWQPGGPWDAQASLVKSLTDARHDLQTAALLTRLYLPEHGVTQSLLPAIDPADEKIVAAQRRAAAPQPYRFVLTRETPAEK
jgi:lysophospholipase L1-like esterase